ncbi:macro domain-containing protein [Streptomyces shenzhenensis]|uniref:macro domain-containing protein n=1 Tax=Streptomyces shenzhenensis TaxID=943815 RepID=UPI003D8AD987
MGQLWAALGTRRGWRLISTNFAIPFAALSGLTQLILAVRPTPLLQGGRVIVAISAVAAIWAFLKSVPRREFSREFAIPKFRVTVKVGNLFSEGADLIVGFTDVFDTSTGGGDIISPRSVQGQLLSNVFGGDEGSLDSALEAALRNHQVSFVESEVAKPRGKRKRYPIGTVAVLVHQSVKYYCVAYSRMGNDLAAQSSVNSLWNCLGGTWRAVAEHGHLNPVAIPVFGSDLARVDNLDHESLIKMIILSFVARSREGVVSRELTVVVHPDNVDYVNLNEVRAFLYSL